MPFLNYHWNIENINLETLPESKVSNTIKKYQIKLYKKFIQDLGFAFEWKEFKKVLIQLPYDHIKWFLEVLKEEKNNSILKNSQIDIVEINPSRINEIENIHLEYENFFNYIKKHDKFVEIYSTIREMETFAKDKDQRKQIIQAYSNFMWKILDFIALNPKLKAYFPSQEQADLENMTLEEFYELVLKASSLDWKEIYQANEELVKLFNENDYVKIIWENANIVFGIKWMKARNSVINWNYPWAEVFSAPVRNQVNWWIYYPNEVFFKFTQDTAKWLYFEFKDWKLIDFDIKENIPNKEQIKQNFLKKFNEKEWNRYLWELAFGTNPYVPVWIKHKLIWEKAFGMHFALGRAYKYPGVNNWNNDASIHWDAIRTLKDNTKVYFWKENWKEILVIENWIYNKEICPKLHKFSLLSNN